MRSSLFSSADPACAPVGNRRPVRATGFGKGPAPSIRAIGPGPFRRSAASGRVDRLRDVGPVPGSHRAQARSRAQCSLAAVMDGGSLRFRHAERMPIARPERRIPTARCNPVRRATPEVARPGWRAGRLASGAAAVAGGPVPDAAVPPGGGACRPASAETVRKNRSVADACAFRGRASGGHAVRSVMPCPGLTVSSGREPALDAYRACRKRVGVCRGSGSGEAPLRGGGLYGRGSSGPGRAPPARRDIGDAGAGRASSGFRLSRNCAPGPRPPASSRRQPRRTRA